MILMDLNLPRLNGLEVIRRLRSSGDFDGVPIVIISALSDDSDRAERPAPTTSLSNPSISTSSTTGWIAISLKPSGESFYAETGHCRDWRHGRRRIRPGVRWAHAGYSGHHRQPQRRES